MFIEVLLFLLLGIIIGLIFGLLPGVHPNLIVLFIPLLVALNLETPLLIALVASIAVTNSITSFLPSILFGVPDSGNELSILPGHKMLLSGYGYQAVKLTVVGGIGAVILCAMLFPVLVIIIPFLFTELANYIYVLLISIVAIMVLGEKKKVIALMLFLVTGFIGLISAQIPVDNTLILFPIFSGFFGISMLLLQMRNRVEIPQQLLVETYISKGLINRSVISGTLAGVFSGLLPGVGASEIATLASTGKNDHAFLVRIGAITSANIILSLLALWLIGKSRSGLAVVIEQLAIIGLEEVIAVLIIALIAGGIASVFTIAIAKKGLAILKNSNYKNLTVAVFIFISSLTYIFAGFYGMLLLATCSAIGVLTNLLNVKRGMLMGVLILPTILFYLPIRLF